MCLKFLYHHTIPVSPYRFHGSQIFVSITPMQSMICANNWVHYGPKFVCILHSLYYNLGDLPQGIEHKIICQIYSVELVYNTCVHSLNYRLCILWVVPFQLTHFSFKYLLHPIIIIISKIWPIGHCWMLSHDAIVCNAYLAMLLSGPCEFIRMSNLPISCRVVSLSAV